jgi:glucose/arabinose dehydrogenase
MVNTNLRTIVACAALALGALGAHAQQPAVPAADPAVKAAPAPQSQPAQQPLTPPPPPSWQQGRPESMAKSTLAPNPPGLTAKAAADMKLSQIKLPPGFQIELWAQGLPNARSIAVGAKGTVFVGTRLVDSVYAVVDKDGKREVKTILKGLHRPNGIVFHNGSLYVAELSRILRYDNIEDKLDNPGPPAVVFDALPKDEPHGWKYMVMGPDGWLYFNIGAPCNACVPPETHATIMRVDPKNGVMEAVAHGVRNSVGMAFHPNTRELWFTNHGRDWMGDDLPHDTLHRMTRKGLHFGYPYCHQGDFLDPELGKGRSCSEFAPPALKLGPHIAPLGMRFYTGKMFPAEYRNRIIIANHGSWNRTKKIGFNLMQVTLDGQGKPVKYEPFAEGWLEGESFWGRPVDVQVMNDGALLVSDDVAGALFRISFKK